MQPRVWLKTAALGLAACAIATAQPQISGSFRTDTRLWLSSSEHFAFTWQEYRLALKTEAKFGDQTRFFSELWTRYYRFPSLSSATDLSSVGVVMPLDISLREAYVDVYGLGLKKLDVRVGRQRIAWGKADRINPTDNLNPDDLEDIWDFGRHLASDGLLLKYYLGAFELQAVFLPIFRPATLPSGKWRDALLSMPQMPAGFESLARIEQLRDTLLTPDNTPRLSSSGGLKLGGKAGPVDFSLSHVYCRDDLPAIEQVTVTPAAPVLTSLPVPVRGQAVLTYPRMYVLGADAAWSIGDVGFWAEGALFFTKKMMTTVRFAGNGAVVRLGALNMPLPDTTLTLDTVSTGKPYPKFVVGLDYTFKNGLYINAQYVHGFVGERGPDLEDYLVVDARWNFFEDRLTIAPFGIGLEVADFSEFADSYALLYQPEVEVKAIDNLSITCGARIIDGRKNTRFGRVTKNDEAYLRAQYSF